MVIMLQIPQHNKVCCNIKYVHVMKFFFLGGIMFQYFVKVVPTIYYNLKGKALATNQFAVTKHQRPVRAATGENGLPGISMTHCM